MTAEIERLIDVALRARVPGGAEVRAWLPMSDDAETSLPVARNVIRAALEAALPALIARIEEVDDDIDEAFYAFRSDAVSLFRAYLHGAGKDESHIAHAATEFDIQLIAAAKEARTLLTPNQRGDNG